MRQVHCTEVLRPPVCIQLLLIRQSERAIKRESRRRKKEGEEIKELKEGSLGWRGGGRGLKRKGPKGGLRGLKIRREVGKGKRRGLKEEREIGNGKGKGKGERA